MSSEGVIPGRIILSTRAIASVASAAALQSYGVVGLAHKNVAQGIVHALARDPLHGIEVDIVDGQILIGVYVVIEYGTRISSVATSVANAVHYQVQRVAGMPVAAVDVRVQALHVSDTD